MARNLARLALLLVLLCAPPAARAGHVETVRVDFAKPLERASLVGFVHGMDARTPSDDRITPLAPALWRGKLSYVPYGRVQDVGGRYTYILSDRWGYPSQGAQPPYADYRKWESFVRRTARQSTRGWVVWDVWNEPDEEHFWQGTPEQLYETYRIAERVLREELGPDVMVTGPSTARFDRDWLVGLLEWCRSRACEVNVLAWHELSDGSIPRLEDNVEAARELMRSSRYAGQRIKEIHVNEAVGPRDQYRPGELLGYMHYLEAGGAHAAARACWIDGSGDDNCINDTLAGLLVPGSMEPRSVWWATKAYAEGVDSRRLTRFSDPHVVGLGSARTSEGETAQLLVGHLERRPAPRGGNRSKVHVKVTLRSLGKLRWLRGRRWLRVRIEKFPNNADRPLPQPVRRKSARVRIRDHQATLTLHHVGLHEAYRLVLE